MSSPRDLDAVFGTLEEQARDHRRKADAAHALKKSLGEARQFMDQLAEALDLYRPSGTSYEELLEAVRDRKEQGEPVMVLQGFESLGALYVSVHFGLCKGAKVTDQMMQEAYRDLHAEWTAMQEEDQ